MGPFLISSLASRIVAGIPQAKQVIGWDTSHPSADQLSIRISWVSAKSLQSCPILCDTMYCSPLDSSVFGILQAKILQWVAISSSRGYSQLRDWTCVSLLAGEFFTTSATHFLAHSYSRHTSIHGLPTRGPRHTRGQGSAFPSRKPAVACRSASPTRGQTPDARKRILQSVDPTCTEQARPYSGTSWSPALPTSSPHKLWDNLDPVCNGVRNWSPFNLQPDTSSWIPESCSQTPGFGSACQ